VSEVRERPAAHGKITGAQRRIGPSKRLQHRFERDEQRVGRVLATAQRVQLRALQLRLDPVARGNAVERSERIRPGQLRVSGVVRTDPPERSPQRVPDSGFDGRFRRRTRVHLGRSASDHLVHGQFATACRCRRIARTQHAAEELVHRRGHFRFAAGRRRRARRAHGLRRRRRDPHSAHHGHPAAHHTRCWRTSPPADNRQSAGETGS
jgi:hypothetical protein